MRQPHQLMGSILPNPARRRTGKGAWLLFGWAADLGTPQTIAVPKGKVARAHLMCAAAPQVAPFGCSLCCSRLRRRVPAVSFLLEHIR